MSLVLSTVIAVACLFRKMKDKIYIAVQCYCLSGSGLRPEFLLSNNHRGHTNDFGHEPHFVSTIPSWIFYCMSLYKSIIGKLNNIKGRQIWFLLHTWKYFLSGKNNWVMIFRQKYAIRKERKLWKLFDEELPLAVAKVQLKRELANRTVQNKIPAKAGASL